MEIYTNNATIREQLQFLNDNKENLELDMTQKESLTKKGSFQESWKQGNCLVANATYNKDGYMELAVYVDFNTLEARKEIMGQVKYSVTQESITGDEFNTLFDTLEEANRYAEDEFNRWCENDRKKNNLVVYELRAENLNDDAFDNDEIDWTCINSKNTLGFEHYAE